MACYIGSILSIVPTPMLGGVADCAKTTVFSVFTRPRLGTFVAMKQTKKAKTRRGKRKPPVHATVFTVPAVFLLTPQYFAKCSTLAPWYPVSRHRGERRHACNWKLNRPVIINKTCNFRTSHLISAANRTAHERER